MVTGLFLASLLYFLCIIASDVQFIKQEKLSLFYSVLFSFSALRAKFCYIFSCKCIITSVPEMFLTLVKLYHFFDKHEAYKHQTG